MWISLSTWVYRVASTQPAHLFSWAFHHRNKVLSSTVIISTLEVKKLKTRKYSCSPPPAPVVTKQVDHASLSMCNGGLEGTLFKKAVWGTSLCPYLVLPYVVPGEEWAIQTRSCVTPPPNIPSTLMCTYTISTWDLETSGPRRAPSWDLFSMSKTTFIFINPYLFWAQPNVKYLSVPNLTGVAECLVAG